MTKSEGLLQEFESEAKKTRKMLERVPFDKADWKPHEKSYTMSALASHIAELPNWVDANVNLDELDFLTMDYKPFVPKDTVDLLKFFDENCAKAVEVLKNTNDEALKGSWTFRGGDTVYFSAPKDQVLRDFVLNHTIHHRAQLGVYLRLNDVPVPQTFGPTADEQM